MTDITATPGTIDWIFDVDGDNDDESEFGFNEPEHYEPGDDEEEED